ncbi:MAG: UDP-N-acetylglucosamine--N-acetylmuramyl-(pentapeptide) pyrophosphoryl-undecaprenol N-acetylglucosamine transferase, partial [Muribaculaceae bacterium]|nr:UDP-N-acetylglucosamine--N-acetylmuramyl-(pentapeptide) pyrophosphoryl-undecaprenol N-acetylglucosamine transferase [Muribaculaceae bacterium]
TGNPIREEILSSTLTPEEARQKLGFDPEKPLLLVVGGSLGARTVNQAMQANIDKLASLGFSILWQTGKNWPEVDPATLPAGCKAVRFIEDMATAYRGASLVVARAGACTISELQNLGKPSILIPSPNVAEDHQRHNAEALVKANAARMILDADAVASIFGVVSELSYDTDLVVALGKNADAMAHR